MGSFVAGCYQNGTCLYTAYWQIKDDGLTISFDIYALTPEFHGWWAGIGFSVDPYMVTRHVHCLYSIVVVILYCCTIYMI